MTSGGRRHILLYDGDCCFCVVWARRVQCLDISRRIEPLNFRDADLAALDPRLTKERCETHVQLLESGGKLSEGFAAIRRISVLVPLLWPVAPFLYLPGMEAVGMPAYDLLARLRLRLSGRY